MMSRPYARIPLHQHPSQHKNPKTNQNRNSEALELPDGSLPLHREMMAGAGAGLCQVGYL